MDLALQVKRNQLEPVLEEAAKFERLKIGRGLQSIEWTKDFRTAGHFDS
jgi:hypothetical protein